MSIASFMHGSIRVASRTTSESGSRRPTFNITSRLSSFNIGDSRCTGMTGSAVVIHINDLGIMNLIMESTILTSLPGRLSSPPQNAEKNSAAAALVNFGCCGGAPYFFRRRRRREHVSGWRGGGIRRLTGLLPTDGSAPYTNTVCRDDVHL